MTVELPKRLDKQRIDKSTEDYITWITYEVYACIPRSNEEIVAFSSGLLTGIEWRDENPTCWISVKEEKPYLADYVLYWGPVFHKPRFGWLGEDRWQSDQYEDSSLEEVTHWMPLPKIPDSPSKE